MIYLTNQSEVLGGVGLVTHLDVDVRSDPWVDTLHGEQGPNPLALLHHPRVTVRLDVEQLKAQTFPTEVDPIVDGCFLWVCVHCHFAVEFHVKWSVHCGPVVTHDVNALMHMVCSACSVLSLSPVVPCPPPVTGISATQLTKLGHLTLWQHSHKDYSKQKNSCLHVEA